MFQRDPLILGFSDNATTQAALAAELLEQGFALEWVGSLDELPPVSEAGSSRRREPGENIFGHSGALLDLVVKRQPALLLFDRDNRGIPWDRWLPLLRRSPATRRIPVLVVADSWTPAARSRARQLGAAATLERGEPAFRLAELAQELARIPDYVAIASACEEPLDPRGRQGIEAYNAGEFYEAHEYLEHAWQADGGAGRDLYRAILQIAVALYQIQRHNYNGAVKMLLRVQQWLHPLPATCRGVDVAALKEDAAAYYEATLALGPERLDQFDWQAVRPVRLLSS